MREFLISYPARRCAAILAALASLLSPRLSAGTLAQFRTTIGDVSVELLDEDKPATVQNFIRYVNSGAYRNVFFHRCLPHFVIQGGGFATADPSSQSNFTVYVNVPTFPPVTNEFEVGRKFSNVYGTIAMAKTAAGPDTATSQWFFNLADNSANLDHQNGGFTVFGRVVGGTNVLNHFNTLAFGAGLVDLRTWYGSNGPASLFSDLPVYYSGLFPPRYSDLVYVDVTLLNVHVTPQPGPAQEIAWDSVAGQTNVVEFTSVMPPVWQILFSTNGTGERLTVTDHANDINRFYRVRVDFPSAAPGD